MLRGKRKGKLRQAGVPVLGPEYSGSQISRGNFYNDADDSDDDPFASAQSQLNSSSDAGDSDEYANPDTVNLQKDTGQDEEIDSAEAFGEDDAEKFQGYVFRGSKSGREAVQKHRKGNDVTDVEDVDEDSGDFSDMESDVVDASESVGTRNGISTGVNGTTLDSSDSGEDDGDVDMEDMSDVSSEHERSRPVTSSSDTDRSSASPQPDADRAALRKLMADSQKDMTSNLSKAARSDITKGRAVKHQRTAFDSLLNTRIRLQKALVATNSVPAIQPNSSDSTDPAVEAAEAAALRLWSTLGSLRHSLESSTSAKDSIPQSPIQADSTTSMATLWTRMQTHGRQMRSQRLSTFNKWSSKTTPVSTLPRANRLAATPTQQPLSAVLEQQLTSVTNMDKLVAKTQIPRSYAPLQAAAALPSTKSAGNHDMSSPHSNTTPIYDDADFYSLLLRDLLEQRSSDPHPSTLPLPGVGSANIPGIKDPALRIHKKQVDTKASKGRKIRYTVQEKVQNFMAPDDRGRWGEKQRDELFRGLLGMKVPRRDDVSMSEDGSEEEGRAEEGLRLFRS
ncbi:MAG: hypothetical protein Q9169_005639 [Polycauliona sp. 2 TL-2023]